MLRANVEGAGWGEEEERERRVSGRVREKEGGKSQEGRWKGVGKWVVMEGKRERKWINRGGWGNGGKIN